MKLLLKLVLTVALLRRVDSRFGSFPEACLDRKTKDAPSKDTEEHLECEEWQDLSCCTTNRTRKIHENIPGPLMIMAPICGEFSQECIKYQKAANCWIQCEPMLHHYQHENYSHFPHQAPICDQYCNEWFDACKGDKICVKDWREGFGLNPDSRDCPADGSTCKTYEEMYGDGQGLCNTMYSTSLRYEASNKDCMVMMFEGDNPNIHGNPYGSANKLTSSLTTSLIVYLIGLWLFSHFL